MGEPVADQGRVRRGIRDAQGRTELVLLPHRVLETERRGPRIQCHDDADVLLSDPESIVPGIEIVPPVAQRGSALRIRDVEQLAVLTLELIEPRIRSARGLLCDE